MSRRSGVRVENRKTEDVISESPGVIVFDVDECEISSSRTRGLR